MPADPIAPAHTAHASGPDAQNTRAPGQAAQGPMIEPVSAAANPHPLTAAAPHGETDAVARGRRIVSTAFVRLGPGGHLLVTLRDGSERALRDVTMEKRALCGVAAAGGSAERQCHRYAEVTAARAVDAAIGLAPVPPG